MALPVSTRPRAARAVRGASELLLALAILPACGDAGGDSAGGGTADVSDTGTSTASASTSAGTNATSGTASTTATSGASSTASSATTTATATGTTDPTTAGSSEPTSGTGTGTGTSDPTTGPAPVTCSSAPAPGEMVCVEGGTFVNGEAPQAERVIGTYWLDPTEVTVAAYAACVTAGGCSAADTSTPACNAGASGREQHPINCVDWSQAAAYCTWAGKRLPDEWEWEWAARGRDEGRTYPWGAESPTCARAVMDDPAAGGYGCGTDRTAPVGSKPAGASRDGALDLAGSVWEWTSSWSDSSQSNRVLRGGSWYLSGAVFLRADARVANVPSGRDSGYGFRCARTP